MGRYTTRKVLSSTCVILANALAITLYNVMDHISFGGTEVNVTQGLNNVTDGMALHPREREGAVDRSPIPRVPFKPPHGPHKQNAVHLKPKDTLPDNQIDPKRKRDDKPQNKKVEVKAETAKPRIKTNKSSASSSQCK